MEELLKKLRELHECDETCKHTKENIESTEEEKRSMLKLHKMVKMSTDPDVNIYDKHAMVWSTWRMFEECWPRVWGPELKEEHISYLRSCAMATSVMIGESDLSKILSLWRSAAKPKDKCKTTIGCAAERLLNSVAEKCFFVAGQKQFPQ